MKFVIVHNEYIKPGGEDSVVREEQKMLQRHGHEVTTFVDSNRRIGAMNRIKLAMRTIWSAESYRTLRALLRAHRPDVALVENTFPLLSPSVYYACRAEGVPVIQRLHNYRFLCLNARLLRNEEVCELCVGRFVPLPGIRYGCYHDSRAQSVVVASMLTFHRVKRTYQRLVDAYIVLTEFARRKFIEGGLPAERIHVKPNILSEDPGVGAGDGSFALFVGRTVVIKGIWTLLEAWKELPDIELRIVGDSAITDELKAFVSEHALEDRVRLLGWKSHAEVLALMKEARLMIFPSFWYEGFPVTIAEAFACGLPVAASDIGALSEVVEEGVNGIHFTAKDPASLRQAVEQLWRDEDRLHSLRQGARSTFEARYRPEMNYRYLMDIVQSVLDARSNVTR